MAITPFTSPVVVDGVISDEKLAELLALRTEYPELDFKARIDPTTTAGIVELAKDVGAMQVRGGYIVGGVDDSGVPTGEMDGADARVFDEANLTPKLLRYLPEPLELRTRLLQHGEHTIIVIYVGRHPSGCAIFRADGQYKKGKKMVVPFRAGDVFWRDGTRSVRLTQQGFEEIIERRIGDSKASWLEEQQEIRRHEEAQRNAAYESRSVADAPLGAVSVDLDSAALTSTVLELLRRDDTIAIRHLFNDARSRASSLLDREDFEVELGDLVDKVTCLAAVYLVYDEDHWFEVAIATLAEIFTRGFGEADSKRFGYMTSIDPAEKGPRVWLLLAERVYALGALAVRRRNWQAVRTLVIQLPEKLDDFHGYWLHFTLVMAARAQHLEERRDGGTAEINLLSRVRNETAHLECLRPEGLTPDDDAIVTSLAQFDFLAAVVAMGSLGTSSSAAFWPSFAQFRQPRIQPIAEQLLSDGSMRQILFPREDKDLAEALVSIERSAHAVGIRYDGFEGWGRTPVGAFIEQHVTSPSS